jgi:Outer membrane protein beta-barrel family
VGLAVQPATIESNSFTGTKLVFKQNIVNYFPMLRIAYNFSKSKSLNLNYDGRTNQPSFQQSQPVPDVSNPQNIIIGNPDLRPEFSNTFSTRYQNFNLISGNTLFSNLSFTFTKDKIVNNVINKLYGAREVRYLNSDGFFNLNTFYGYSKPIQNRKYVFNVGGTINYNSYTSFLDNTKNKGKNYIITQRFSMDYRLKNWMETSGGAVFSFNETKNSLASSPANSIKAWSLTHSSRFFFKHDFNFSYDLSQALNYGYTSNVVANPLIANATLEKMFLKSKNASFKLQGFDLFNQNTNINRSVSQVNASITDTRTNRVQRFFMLSFIYRFNKFVGAKAGPGMSNTPPPPPGMGGGMRMGF